MLTLDIITLVVDSEVVPPQIAQLAARLREEKKWQLEVALSGRKSQPPSKLLAAIQWFEARLMALSSRPPTEFAHRRLDVTTNLSSTCGVCINASASLDDATLSSLTNAPVLSSTSTRAGYLLGFREVFEGVRGSTFDVCLTLPGDATRCVVSGRLQTQLFYLENLQSLAEHTNHYLVDYLRQGNQTPADTTSPPLQPSTHPRFAAYLWRVFARFTSKALPILMGRRLTWNVAARSENGGSMLSVLQNPPGCFSADPFVISRDGESYCFVEEYSFVQPKGIIVCYRIQSGQFERLGVALEEPFHLSFPFLFEANGELFMCPESAANRDVRIYRCTNFPLAWSLHSVALDSIAAVDTIIVRRNARWWMITCINPLGAGTQFSEMRIFSADTVDGPWTPHALNPLRIDEVEARNGGFFERAGKLYRVNQVQGFGVYGESVGINQIMRVDDREYCERPISLVPPITRPDIIGVHHLSRCGDITVFDFSTIC